MKMCALVNANGGNKTEIMDKTGAEAGYHYEVVAGTATVSGTWVFMLGGDRFPGLQVQRWSGWEHDDR